MRLDILVIAYFSPETMLPLSSVIATIAGFALMIKRSSFLFAARSCRAVFRRARKIGRRDSPHIRIIAKELESSNRE